MKQNWVIQKTDLVLITGANGFVGSKVYEILLEQGFKRLRCMIRSPRQLTQMKQMAKSANADVEFIEGNLLSSEDCRHAAREVSIVFHLAAGRGKSFAGCFMDSAVATRNLLEALQGNIRLKRFVNVSTLAVYAGSGIPRGALLDETSPIEDDHAGRYEAYCYGKIKQDELVQTYGAEHGLPYVIVRPGLVYGPGKKAIPGRVGIDTFGFFIHLGGSNRIPMIYIDNCAEAIVASGLVGDIDGEVFNAVDDDLPTSREFLRLYKKNVRRIFSIYIPYRGFYLLNWLWEKYAHWSEGQLPPLFNRRVCAAYYQKQLYSNKKLKEKTGWNPRVSFSEASQRYFDFMRNGEARH